MSNVTIPRHAVRGGRILRPHWVGIFFLWTSGIHVGIVAADPGFYAPFADHALVPGLTHAWSHVVMGSPTIFGLAVAAGEATLGLLLLGSPQQRRVGWSGVLAFQLALMAFGWGFWIWSLPALAMLLPAAVADSRSAR
jgi:hypothetical protein